MLPPFFMPAEKRENCDASVCTRVFLRRGKGPPFVGKSCVSPSPLLAKKLFSGPVLCPAIALWHQKKRPDAYKKDPFHPSGRVVYQTGSEGLRGVIGDVCLLPVPGPSPKSSAISFHVVTLTRLTPKIKKAAESLPQPCIW